MDTLVPFEKMTKSVFAETFMTIKGKPYSLNRYPMFRRIYNDDSNEKLLKTGRQVSKSTYNSKDIILDSIRLEHFQTLFITPLQEQTVRFSRNYLGHDMKTTPIVQEYFMDRYCQDNVFARSFSNNSLVQLSYSLLDAERVRGIPADKLVFDEVQDIPYENIPIINECLSASEYKMISYTGTPKTKENTIEQLWKLSTQCEWCIKCSACKRINVPDEEHVWEMIGREYPICAYCKSDIRNDIPNGEWYIRNPDWEDPDLCQMTGYHLPQIIMPIHFEPNRLGKNVNWETLRKKFQRYSKAQFANECLGLSFDQGGRLVTLTELEEISTGKVYETYSEDMEVDRLYAGIDWGISAQTSFTYLTIGGFCRRQPGVFKVFLMRRFMSMDLLDQIESILKICHDMNVYKIAADRGVGVTNNLILSRNFGEDRVVPFNYATCAHVTGRQRGRDYITLDKTSSLNLMFLAMKQRLVQLPPKKFMKDGGHYKDFLAIYEQINESTKGIYKVMTHSPKEPDDGAHALNFAMFAAYLDIDHPYTRMATSHDFLLEDYNDSSI